MRNFWNLKKLTFFKFSKLEIFGVVKIEKINKRLNFVQFGKKKFGSKNWQSWNCLSVRYSALLAIFPIFIFALWYKSIFLIFISYFSNPWVRSLYIWTFVNFQIRNVSYFKMLLFEISTLILQIESKLCTSLKTRSFRACVEEIIQCTSGWRHFLFRAIYRTRLRSRSPNIASDKKRPRSSLGA